MDETDGSCTIARGYKWVKIACIVNFLGTPANSARWFALGRGAWATGDYQVFFFLFKNFCRWIVSLSCSSNHEIIITKIFKQILISWLLSNLNIIYIEQGTTWVLSDFTILSGPSLGSRSFSVCVSLISKNNLDGLGVLFGIVNISYSQPYTAELHDIVLF